MRGLYLITNDDPIELLLAKLEGAMATYEVAVLQYRRKKVIDQEARAYEIGYMKHLCAQYKVPFVINDDLDAAVAYGVGVHLGQDDGSIVEAVSILEPPPTAIIASAFAALNAFTPALTFSIVGLA